MLGTLDLLGAVNLPVVYALSLVLGVVNAFDNPARRGLAPVHHFLWNKWWFDELYHALFVRPAHWIAQCVAGIDRQGIDWLAIRPRIKTAPRIVRPGPVD